MKKKITQYLLYFTILLLTANIIVDLIAKKNKPRFENDISSSVIENIYLETLDEEGIELNLIKIKRNREEEKDSLKNIFNVRIPGDLPFSVFMNYLQTKLNYPFIKLRGEEKKKDKELKLSIYSNNTLKLESNIIKDENLSRPGAKLSFIITGFNGLSKSRQEELLKSPFPFAVELVPSDKEAGMVDSLKKFRKEHTVLLNDDISGKNFLLLERYSEGKLMASIKNIITSFKYYPVYMIDTGSDLFGRPKYGIVEKEILRNKIRLEKRNAFICLDDEKRENIINKLTEAANGRENKNKIFLIEGENYLSVFDEINKLFRKGNKIISPSENL